MFNKNSIVTIGNNIIKPETIDLWLEEKESPLKGLGAFLLDVCNGLEIDVRFILAVIGLESTWGKSNIAQKKKNLFGWGAIDSDPAGGAWRFNTFEGCIAVILHKFRKHWIDRGFNTVYKMRDDPKKDYSSAKDSEQIVKLMNQIEEFRVQQEKNQ